MKTPASASRISVSPIVVPLCGLVLMLIATVALRAAGQSIHAIGLLPYMLLLVGPLLLIVVQGGYRTPGRRTCGKAA